MKGEGEGDPQEVPGEPNTIGLSSEAHTKLKRLREDGYFGEMRDAYRFAVALALAHGALSAQLSNTVTIFNVGTLDKDGSLYLAVKALRDNAEQEPVYKTMERLAEWGVEELHRRISEGSFSLRDLFAEVDAKV